MSGLVATRLRAVVQTTGMVRKEIAQTLRQPQLVLLLVAGPFVILLIFGLGYDEDHMALRTRFVGPPDSIYQTAIDDYAELLTDYVVPAGYTSDLFEARRALRDGEVDLVVAFPTDPGAELSEGRRATITILHDKIDPIQLTAVEIAARLAVGEVNATVLETLVDQGLDGLRPVHEELDVAVAAADDLEQATNRGDASEARDHRAVLGAALDNTEMGLRASATVLSELDPATGEAHQEGLDDIIDQIGRVRDTADRYTENAETGGPTGSTVLTEQVSTLTESVAQRVDVPPRVIVRPFASNIQHLGDRWITPNDFFAPATIALLLAHIGVTFGAMSVVADRRLGVFESYRVAPLGASQVLASKYIAFLAVGGVVGAALLAAVMVALGVPLLGSVVWVAVAVAGVVLASIGLGLIVAALARTDSQAVQYAMLVLFAGLFFGGFFLDLDAFATPVQWLSQALPVTHGISMLHDVMLRGLEPEILDVVGLTVLTLVYGVAAALLTRWQLRAR